MLQHCLFVSVLAYVLCTCMHMPCVCAACTCTCCECACLHACMHVCVCVCVCVCVGVCVCVCQVIKVCEVVNLLMWQHWKYTWQRCVHMLPSCVRVGIRNNQIWGSYNLCVCKSTKENGSHLLISLACSSFKHQLSCKKFTTFKSSHSCLRP